MGLLITIEGGEFVGKSSVVAPFIKKLAHSLGVDALVSREPGGTPEGEKIRQLIFKRLKEGAKTMELALLFNKARKIHLKDVVIPFLGKNKEKNTMVVLDRYLDTTRVYQGLFGGISVKELKRLEEEYVKGYYPDLTVIMYFPEDVFEKTFRERERIANAEVNNRDKNNWDLEDIKTHLEKQRAFLRLPEIANEYGEKREFIAINAAQTPDEVRNEIEKKLIPFLKKSSRIHLTK
jgi:dTMP kinase